MEDGFTHKFCGRPKHFSVRTYTYRELSELLKETGFGDFEAYDTVTGEPFGPDAKRLALVARKIA